MKKLVIMLGVALAAFSSQAVTLFPYFVDVAGDYNEGVPEELAGARVEMKYSSRPSFYKSLDEAKAFYADVMPFSTETIEVKDVPLEEGRITIYGSGMLDGKVSIIYLIETPEKTFYIGYDEMPAH